MSETIKGKTVLQALEQLDKPVSIDELMNYMVTAHGFSQSASLRRTVEAVLEDGLKFGFIEVTNDKYLMVDKGIEDSTGNEVNHSITDILRNNPDNNKRVTRLYCVPEEPKNRPRRYDASSNEYSSNTRLIRTKSSNLLR